MNTTIYQKILSAVLMLLCISSAHATDGLLTIKADRAYTSGNLTQLSRVYSLKPHDEVIRYMYAKALLTKNIANLAQEFVQQNSDSFLRDDLLHQLLLFYFSNKNYNGYLRSFKELHFTETSLNEKCGADYASLMLDTASTSITNRGWIINNNVPLWCAKLIALQYKRGIVDKQQRDLLLYNLIINGKIDIFNMIANDFGINQVNFNHYQNYPITHLAKNSEYQYLAVSRMAAIAHQYPDIAKREFDDADLDSVTEVFLGNYLAMQFALKQNFGEALKLYSKYSGNVLSDQEQEWKIRSYMFYGKWSSVLDSIDAMSSELKHQDIWLYWSGIAYMHLGKTAAAQKMFSAVPADYSYYSMLAQARINHDTKFYVTAPLYNNIGSTSTLSAAHEILSLYKLAKNNSDSHLMALATNGWYYLVKFADSRDCLDMSILAAREHAYHLSIFAADHLPIWYLSLSFPTPFLDSYMKFSQVDGLKATYPLAISRQESRFNYSVIAFDGGVGLMQIMPGTAAYIARKMGARNCYHQSPQCNIKFGTWYLSDLLSKFNGNLIYATAAYNAGPHRVRMWQDALGSLDNQIQIELIPIDITRAYVQKVLSNKAAYASEFEHSNTVDLLSYIDGIPKTHYLDTPDDDNTDIAKLHD